MKKAFKFFLLSILSLFLSSNFKTQAGVSQAMMSSVSGYLSFESCNDFINHQGELVPCLFFLVLSTSVVLPRKVQMVKPLALTVTLSEQPIKLESLDPRLSIVIEEINHEIRNQDYEPLDVKDVIVLIATYEHMP
jgi:hypothetical protein